MERSIKKIHFSINEISIDPKDLSYFKEYTQGMDGSLMEYDLGGEVFLEINGIQIKDYFRNKPFENTFFVWYPLFFLYTTDILSHIPLNVPIRSDVLDIEDFSWNITELNFPTFFLTITQCALDNDKRYNNLEINYFDFKKEIIREQGKLMKFLEDINNPNIIKYHPNFKSLMDGWKLIQTDYFDRTFPSLTISQLEKEAISENTVISKLAKERLQYLKKKK